MKKLALLLTAAVAAVSCTFVISNKIVRGNGEEVVKTYEFPEIQSIAIAGSMDVIYKQGPQSVSLVTDENLADLYEINVVNGVLRFSSKNGYSLLPKVNTVLRVSTEDLSGVRIAGSGDCSIEGTLRTDGDFSFVIAGSGDLDAGKIVCKEFKAKVDGSGDVDVDSLTADSAVLSINGSGDIEIGLKDAGSIQARINGSGDISLSGSARSLDSHVNGSGGIHTSRLQLRV